MQDRHYKFWPKGRPYELPALETTVFENLVWSTGRYPDHPAIIYYDAVLTYDELLADVISFAAYLREERGVERNDRVLLYMQNSPQFIIGYYGILAANAVVVPVNPMCRTGELEHIPADTEAVAVICGQELAEHVLPLLETTTLRTLIHASYGDYSSTETDLDLPKEVAQNRQAFAGDNTIDWWDAVGFDGQVPQVLSGPDDWCAQPRWQPYRRPDRARMSARGRPRHALPA